MADTAPQTTRTAANDAALLNQRLLQYKQAAVFYKRQSDLAQAKIMLGHVRNIQDALEKLDFVKEGIFTYEDVRSEFELPPPLPAQILNDLQRMAAVTPTGSAAAAASSTTSSSARSGGSLRSSARPASAGARSSPAGSANDLSINTAASSGSGSAAVDSFSSLLDILDTQIASCTAASAYYYVTNQKPVAVTFHRYKKQFQADRDTLLSLQRQHPGSSSGTALPQVRYQDVQYQVENAFADVPVNELQVTMVRAMGLYAKEVAANDICSFVSWDLGGYPETGEGRGDTDVVRNAMNPEYNATKNIRIERNRALQRHFERKKATLEVFHRGGGILGFGLLAKNISLGKVIVKLDTLLTKSEINQVADLLDANRRPTGGKIEFRIRLRQPLMRQDIETRNERWAFVDSWSPVHAQPRAGEETAAPASSNAALEAAEAWLEDADNVISNLVIENELKLTKLQLVEATRARNTAAVHDLETRKDVLDNKLMMLQINVQSGLLTMDAYSKQLESAIKVARQHALTFKRNERLDLAKRALARTQLMQKEIDEIKDMVEAGAGDEEEEAS
ncbi:hypothetical protein RI367_000249 [Sorochytrium milnesiophthora]